MDHRSLAVHLAIIRTRRIFYHAIASRVWRIAAACFFFLSLAATPTVSRAGGVRIQQPRAHATVSGNVSVVVSIQKPVIACTVYIDGRVLGSSLPDASSQFSVPWNSSSFAPGKHTISAAGYNARNRKVAKQSIAVKVVSAGYRDSNADVRTVAHSDRHADPRPRALSNSWSRGGPSE